MPLTHRDKRALLLLAIVVPVLLLLFYGEALLSALRADSPEYIQARRQFAPLHQKMKSYDRWSSEIASAQKRLHIKVSSSTADQQKDEFLKKLEDEGLKRQVQITGHRWLRVTRSTKTPGLEKRAFQIDCTAQVPNLIEFVKGIEELTVPVVIDEISFSRRQGAAAPGARSDSQTPSGEPRRRGGRGGGGGQGNEQQLKATLQLHLYIFPEGGGNDSSAS